ncbi:choline ABC transporter permease, partial [Staphylococcus epidermidis]|nr:choline ABC transporter permease [Staphylococcus epidermidis]
LIYTGTYLGTANALIVSYVLSLIEKWVVPKGLKVSR